MQDIDRYEFVDERQKGWCIHCARSLTEVKQTRDHVPTKTLLHPPYPANLPIVLICEECNRGFSKDEQYLVAFVSTVLAGTTDPEHQWNDNAARILRHNHMLREAIDRSKKEYVTRGGETNLVWTVDLTSVKKVVVKNARGHAFYEYGEPMLQEPDSVSVVPLLSLDPREREAFENISGDDGVFAPWPEVGSRMLVRVFSGQDLQGGWVIVQEGVYRYAVTQSGGGLLVRSIISEYLATEVYWQ